MGTVLVVLGTGARIGLAPGPSTFSREAGSPSAESAAGRSASAPDTSAAPITSSAGEASADTPLEGVRAAVDENLERARRAARPLAPGERIDPNVAPPVELQRLPGLGPARARGVIREREEGGPYRTLEDLARVSGIGPATLQKLAPHVTLSASSSPASGTAAAGPRGGAGRDRIDVNRASIRRLQALPGVGPVVAERIVHERARSGRFRSPDDLLRVPGIGPSRLERIRELIVVR